MSLQRRHVLVVVTLAAATATAAFGQTAAPGFGAAGGGSQAHAAIPDFSASWARLSLPGFEPPLSGPGPVRNKSRLPNGVANFQKTAGPKPSDKEKNTFISALEAEGARLRTLHFKAELSSLISKVKSL